MGLENYGSLIPGLGNWSCGFWENDFLPCALPSIHLGNHNHHAPAYPAHPFPPPTPKPTSQSRPENTAICSPADNKNHHHIQTPGNSAYDRAVCWARRLKRSFSKKSLLIFNITTTTNCPLKWTLFPDSIDTYILPIAKITSAQIE